MNGAGRKPSTLLMKTMRPLFCARIAGSTACVRRAAPRLRFGRRRFLGRELLQPGVCQPAVASSPTMVCLPLPPFHAPRIYDLERLDQAWTKVAWYAI